MQRWEAGRGSLHRAVTPMSHCNWPNWFQFLQILTNACYLLFCFIDYSHPNRCEVNVCKVSVMQDKFQRSAVDAEPVVSTLLYTEKFVERLSQIKCSYHTHTRDGGGRRKLSAGEDMFITLWWWFHECMIVFKSLKLYALNMCHFFVYSYTSVKIFFMQKEKKREREERTERERETRRQRGAKAEALK